MKNKIILQTFETDSLPLSAYLICNSCSFKEIKSSPIPGKYLFVFYPDTKIKKLETDFFSFKALVIPQAYYNAVRDIKRFLIEFRNKDGGR
jgi:hypothetical protein